VEASAFSLGGRDGAFLFATQTDIKFLAIAMTIWYFWNGVQDYEK